MSGENSFREEIEQMLRTHNRSHFAQHFLRMERGLSLHQIPQEMRVTPARAIYGAVTRTRSPLPADMLKTVRSVAGDLGLDADIRELLLAAVDRQEKQHAA